MELNVSKHEYAKLKRCIKEWIISLNQVDKLSKDIKALNFGLYEPYGIELIGAKVYDPDDSDWACEEDFVPTQRDCPNFEVIEDIKWEDFLNVIIQILQELTVELKDLEILNVDHITTGFCDGDLIVIK